jgi:hypothetical protein
MLRRSNFTQGPISDYLSGTAAGLAGAQGDAANAARAKKQKELS